MEKRKTVPVCTGMLPGNSRQALFFYKKNCDGIATFGASVPSYYLETKNHLGRGGRGDDECSCGFKRGVWLIDIIAVMSMN
ncbi:hypothetical protein [Paenibacillus pinihumi]|uniref:hypothetical protein n=1 Tax=Paenibacillus pinihumi TaxID=669462 RepID=UPI0012B51B95|nr:hypothetical protein [Paenibacillus pinihumi]